MGDKNPAARKKKAAQKLATLERAKKLAQGNEKNAAKKKANRAK
ncbi:hypothetical protein [Anaerosporobacter faecicola]|nr:hypothetical protein [Anaerosporobacter faecicola]